MIVVAAACPLIFLAKIGQLGLIRELFPCTVLIPQGVHQELLDAPMTPAEEQGLPGFIKSCRGVQVQHQFRISIEVYDAILQRIEAHRER